jgi:hypothetical protein
MLVANVHVIKCEKKKLANEIVGFSDMMFFLEHSLRNKPLNV